MIKKFLVFTFVAIFGLLSCFTTIEATHSGIPNSQVIAEEIASKALHERLKLVIKCSFSGYKKQNKKFENMTQEELYASVKKLPSDFLVSNLKNIHDFDQKSKLRHVAVALATEKSLKLFLRALLIPAYAYAMYYCWHHTYKNFNPFFAGIFIGCLAGIKILESHISSSLNDLDEKYRILNEIALKRP